MTAFDLKLAEMLASRLCHDLVNPLGAVANGVELLAEFCDTMQKDALDLVAASADRAMKRVQFFRFAYGFAGHDEGRSVEELRSIVEGFLADGKIDLDWRARADEASGALPRSGLKLLAATVALGAEALPRGGTLAVSLDAPVDAAVEAAGVGARLEPASAAMMATLAQGGVPELSALDAKTVGAAYAGRLAGEIGARIVVETGPDRVGLALRFG